jgi:predicted MFS family arabinose efflux permease
MNTQLNEARTASVNGWIVPYIAIVVAMMTMQMSSLGFAPLIPDMKATWHMNYAQIGTFTGIYGLMAMLGSLPAGLVIKRFGV